MQSSGYNLNFYYAVKIYSHFHRFRVLHPTPKAEHNTCRGAQNACPCLFDDTYNIDSRDASHISQNSSQK